MKQDKILIIKFHKEELLGLEKVIEIVKSHFSNPIIHLATNLNQTLENTSFEQIHYYQILNKDDKFLKRLFSELKFIFGLKKQKYKLAIIASPSEKSAILAKYAKIKTIIGYETQNRNIDEILNYKIEIADKNDIESRLREILKSIKTS